MSWFSTSGRKGYSKKVSLLYHFVGAFASVVFWWGSPKPVSLLGFDGESAGARTQDQRLKRAMLYQLSYALKPHYQVSTFGGVNFVAKPWQRKLLHSTAFTVDTRSRTVTLKSHNGFIDLK
jgi:hypothetical protein